MTIVVVLKKNYLKLQVKMVMVRTFLSGAKVTRQAVNLKDHGASPCSGAQRINDSLLQLLEKKERRATIIS